MCGVADFSPVRPFHMHDIFTLSLLLLTVLLKSLVALNARIERFDYLFSLSFLF